MSVSSRAGVLSGADTLYIKTHSDIIAIVAPPHNLTLTRTAMEVIDLHNKLKDSHPNVKLPILPIDVSTVPTPTKRK